MAEKLSHGGFLESLRLAPRLVIELVVENNEGEILLLKRDRDPFKGKWYLPGGFLLKGESIGNCMERLSQDGLNFRLDSNEGEFLGLFENIDGDPRGHILHYVVRFKSGEVGNGSYFKELPQETISYQRDFLVKLGYK